MRAYTISFLRSARGTLAAMSVYTPRQASDTSLRQPVQAGTQMYGLGDAAPKRQTKYLIAFGVIVAAGVGLLAFAGKSSRNRGLSGIGEGELKLTRSLPAK